MLPDHLREFSDTAKARQWIYNNALESVKARFPVEDDNYKLELSDPHYEGPQEYSLSKQKQALLKQRRLYTPIRGTWRLTHKPSGALLDERYDTVMQVPYLTDRGTFILGGSEYAGINQQRLKSGVYTRITNKGNSEAFFNVKPGSGKNFRLSLEPETGIFKINVGQSSIPVYPFLKAMGVDDKTLMNAWGPQLTESNIKARSADTVNKLYTRFIGKFGDPNELNKERALYDSILKHKIDPDVVARTLGIKSDHVTPEMLVRATSKLLAISRAEEEPDDRDSPVFSNVLSYEDFIKERIDNDAGRLSASLLNKVKRDKSLKRLPFSALNPYVDGYVQGSKLTSPLEETNPMHLWDQMHRLIRMGEGGISSAESVTDAARDVNIGQLGFIDPVAGPESSSVGVDTRLSYRTFKGKDRQMYGEFNNVRTGKKEYLRPEDFAGKTIAYPGEDISKPNNNVMAVRDGKMLNVPASTIDVQVPSLAHMFSQGANLTPMVTGMMPGRAFYASKYWSQFMPLVKGEVPLVDVQMPDSDDTFSEYYGKKIASITSPIDGQVIKVNDDSVVVRGSDGKNHEHDLVKNFPYNRITSISYFPSVKVGDPVKAGSLLAHSNFSDSKTGSLNMGVNLRVAIMPGPTGDSYEDAHYISESAAKKLMNERTYGFDLEGKHGINIDKHSYVAQFPRKYNKEQIDKMDDTGVVKKGAIVNTGDPIILATGPKVLTAQDAQLGKLHKALRNVKTDKSVAWEHDYPGEVVDVESAGSTAIVNVKAQVPIKVGDKIVTSHALKGVTGRVVSDDKMPRNAVTNEPYEMLLNPMGILSRVSPNQLAAIALGKVAKKTGNQIRLPSTPPKEGWAQWTLNQLKENGLEESSDVFDPDTGSTIKNIGDGYVYTSAFHHIASHKLSDRGSGAGAYSASQQPAHGGFEGGAAKRFGCFTADQRIRVLGGELEIGHIVEKRIPALVWACDDNGVMGYHRITNWFVRPGTVSEVLNVKVAHLPCCHKNQLYPMFRPKTLKVTKNHVMYRPDLTTVTAGELKAGEWLASYGYQLTDDQHSILIGTMLGDGSITNSRTSHPSYQCMHSEHQSNYCNWKQNVLQLLVSNRTSTAYKSSCGFGPKTDGKGHRTRICYYAIHSPAIVDYLSSIFINNGKKHVTESAISLIDDLALCVWFLDDGWIGNHGKESVSLQGHMSTQGFTDEENDLLIAFLNKRFPGAKCNARRCFCKNYNKYHTSIYLDKKSSEGIVDLLCKRIPHYAIPASKKWLCTYIKEYQDKHGIPSVNGNSPLGVRPVKIISIDPYKHHKATTTLPLYDIEVADVHKYCASDVIVSNSLDIGAALSHGAQEVIKDVINVRGTKNEEYWKALKLGRPIPEPTTPFIYEKFLNLLKSGGINLSQKGDTLSLLPMTDDDISQLSRGPVTSADMVNKNFEPVKGGLFDPAKTGGLAGKFWSHITLTQPVPNPVFEEPIRRLLGLRQADLEDIIAGTKELNGMTGGQALISALGNVDVDKEINKHKESALKLRGSNRDNSIKILGYLTSLKKQGIHPSKLMINKIPVLPPVFRPISLMGDVMLQSDMNMLYRDVLETNDNIGSVAKELGNEGAAEERLNNYNAVKAVFGLDQAITAEGKAKNLKGSIRQIIGDRPKHGLFQSKVISKPVDAVGRGVITPDSSLDMDSVGIPEESAWKLYQPFVMRRLVRRGLPPEKVMQLIKDRDNTAKIALLQELDERPVILDRAPTWHKFNLVALRPKLIQEDVLRISPLITSSISGDFDGDQMNFHVPVSAGAVKDAYDKMLPSKNLTSLTDLKSVRHPPSKEFAMGLYMLTRDPSNKPVKMFNTKEDAKAAYKRGEIAANDPIEILADR